MGILFLSIFRSDIVVGWGEPLSGERIWELFLIAFIFFFQEEKLPNAFFISDRELVEPPGVYLEKNKG